MKFFASKVCHKVKYFQLDIYYTWICISLKMQLRFARLRGLVNKRRRKVKCFFLHQNLLQRYHENICTEILDVQWMRGGKWNGLFLSEALCQVINTHQYWLQSILTLFTLSKNNHFKAEPMTILWKWLHGRKKLSPHIFDTMEIMIMLHLPFL